MEKVIEILYVIFAIISVFMIMRTITLAYVVVMYFFEEYDVSRLGNSLALMIISLMITGILWSVKK